MSSTPTTDRRQELLKLALLSLADEGLHPDVTPENAHELKLLGGSAVCDSTALVGFLVGFEQRINTRWGSCVALMDERAMSQIRSPFRNLGVLIEFADELIDETQGALGE
ncbi:MAG: hypothetical protein JW940_27065 [Polyangiaceae bacterium]|nr:hypothetical protein [Polyangiaceae bacterium]